MNEIIGSVTGLGSEAIYYYLIAIASLLYIFLNNKKDGFSILLILLFSEGIWGYFGFTQVFKSIVLFYIIVLNLKFINERANINTRPLVFTFLILSLFFIASSFYNYDTIHYNLLQIFAQYAKFLTPFLALILFCKCAPFIYKRKIIYELIVLQIILSFIKLIIIGGLEGVVGSIAFLGGHVATLFPIIAFIYLFTIKDSFKKRDWIITLLLFVIGFASYKRAIWFIFPLMIFLFTSLKQNSLNLKRVFIIIPILLLVTYFGVRLNPSLNPDNSLLGRFDSEFVLNYANEYTFGSDNKVEAYGRGGALIVVLENLHKTPLMGYGFHEVALSDYDSFDNVKMGISSKASISGLSALILSYGFLFTIIYIIFCFQVAFYVPNKKYRLIFLLFILWELFLYKGSLLSGTFLSIFFMLIISNFYEKNNYLTKEKHI